MKVAGLFIVEVGVTRGNLFYLIEQVVQYFAKWNLVSGRSDRIGFKKLSTSGEREREKERKILVSGAQTLAPYLKSTLPLDSELSSSLERDKEARTECSSCTPRLSSHSCITPPTYSLGTTIVDITQGSSAFAPLGRDRGISDGLEYSGGRNLRSRRESERALGSSVFIRELVLSFIKENERREKVGTLPLRDPSGI